MPQKYKKRTTTTTTEPSTQPVDYKVKIRRQSSTEPPVRRIPRDFSTLSDPPSITSTSSSSSTRSVTSVSTKPQNTTEIKNQAQEETDSDTHYFRPYFTTLLDWLKQSFYVYVNTFGSALDEQAMSSK